MYKFFSILVIQLFLLQNTFAQPVLKLPFNKKISINDGLSSYNIKKIIQDRYGFIWIATQDGLNRYDGKSFLIYNKSLAAGYRLLGNDVWDIQEDDNRDILWVVTSYGGVDGIDLKTAKVCSSLRTGISNEGSGSNWLRCIQILNNRIWIGSYNGLTIYNLLTKKYEQYESIPFYKNRHAGFSIDNIYIDHNKNIWLFIANYGIVIYSAYTLKIINYYSLPKLFLAYRPAVKQFNSVTSISLEKLLIGTNQGFRRIDYNATGIRSVSYGVFDNDRYFSQGSIEASNIDPSGDIWFSASSKLFKVKLNDKTIQEVKDCNTDIGIDWLNYVDAIFFDKQNNIWLGTRKGAAYTKNAIPAFTPYFVSDDLSAKIDHAYSIYPYSDSVIYAGTEAGLLKINTVDNRISTIDKGKLYYLITEHTDKNLLVSNEEGFFVYKRNKKMYPVSDYYPELNPLKNTTINRVC